MQITEQTNKNIISASKKLIRKPDVLYFASLGAMDMNAFKDCIESLRSHWKGELGIHAHNNLGKAVANSLAAIQGGVTWIDSTITGMGRGPGNSETEYILIEMQKFSKKNLIFCQLQANKKLFRTFKLRYKWDQTHFFTAGKHSIHPTFKK